MITVMRNIKLEGAHGGGKLCENTHAQNRERMKSSLSGMTPPPRVTEIKDEQKGT